MSVFTTKSTHKTSKLVGALFLLSLIIPIVNWVFILSTFASPDGNSALEIQNNELLFRLAIFIEIVTSVIVLALAYYLHIILKTINENLSFMAFILRVIEAILTMVLAMGHFIGLLVLKEEVGESIILIDVLVGKYIFLTSFLGIFMGLSMLLYSCLFLKSGYILKKLAIFGIVSYILVIVYDSTIILFPEYGSIFFVQIIGGIPVCLFQLIIGFWLLFKGINFTKKKPTMKAVIYKKYGAPEVLELIEIAKPIPKNDEVLIKIKATSVTNADCYMRRADTLFSRLILGLSKPKKRYQILGTEFSGIIEAIGSDVKEWKIGDEVFGFRGFGTGCYAEYKCMSANGSLAKKPINVSFEEAVSMVDGATTALFFLKEKAKIKSGQKVLINGASGSIGTFAVQLAKYFGAEVTGVCSSKNLELVKSLGADIVIDYTKEDFTQRNESYDIIFDTVSKSTFRKCKKAMAEHGLYIDTMFSLTRILQSIWTGWFCKKKVIFAMSVNKTEALNFIKGLVENDKLKTIIDRYYKFEQTIDAHKYVESGHKKGNIVIRI